MEGRSDVSAYCAGLIPGIMRLIHTFDLTSRLQEHNARTMDRLMDCHHTKTCSENEEKIVILAERYLCVPLGPERVHYSLLLNPLRQP